MSSDNDEMKSIYELGKSIRGIGTSLLWSNIYCLLILFGFMELSLYVPILIYLTFGPLAAIAVFQILNMIYKIKMTIQGFNIASEAEIKKYKMFSLFYIISYVIIMTMYGILAYLILFKGMGIITFILNPSYDPYNAFSQYAVQFNLILIVPTIVLFGGYAMRIISWFYLKDGINETSNYGLVREVLSSKCTQMIAWLIVLAIFNLILIISIFYPDAPTIVLVILVVIVFYIFEVNAYRSIGRLMKTVYDESTSSKSSYKYSQQSVHNSSNPISNPAQELQSSSQQVKNSVSIPNDGFVYCPKCGSPNSINDENCQTCGEPLKK